jgi:hypothetical protein
MSGLQHLGVFVLLRNYIIYMPQLMMRRSYGRCPAATTEPWRLMRRKFLMSFVFPYFESLFAQEFSSYFAAFGNVVEHQIVLWTVENIFLLRRKCTNLE